MRHSVIPAAYVFLKKEGKLLFSRRFQTGYEDGMWSLPAGHVEAGETYTQCAIREIKEEIGVELKKGDLQVAHVLQRDSQTPENNERMELFFVVEKWRGEPRIMEPHKCDGLEWFDADGLSDTVIPYIRHVVDMMKKGILYSEYGFEEVSNKNVYNQELYNLNQITI